MRRPGLLAAAAAAAALVAAARAQQFDGPNLRYPEHAREQPAAPWAAGVVREQVEANATIKEGLSRHGVFLVPNPPHPPQYAAKGTQMAGLTPDKVRGFGLGLAWVWAWLGLGLVWVCVGVGRRRRVAQGRSPPRTPHHTPPAQDFGYQAGSDGGEGVNWCTTPGNAPEWTSERGSVMLDGHPVWLKGINWCVWW